MTESIKKLGILMGLFSGLFGGSASAEQYHSDTAFKENLERQTAMAPQTLDQLREYGVTDESELKLEYFFYTNSEEKAKSLDEALSALGYAGEHGLSASDRSIYVITGWTVPLKMSEDSVVEWVDSMCRLGFEHDAEFDGWGTYPEQ